MTRTGRRLLLVEDDLALRTGLADTFAGLPPSIRSLGTLHLWRGRNGPPWRVDHILVSPDGETLAAGVHLAPAEVSLASDHHPVWAEVRWPGA